MESNYIILENKCYLCSKNIPSNQNYFRKIFDVHPNIIKNAENNVKKWSFKNPRTWLSKSIEQKLQENFDNFRNVCRECYTQDHDNYNYKTLEYMMYLSQDNTLSFDEQQLWASRAGILQDNWYTTRTELPKNLPLSNNNIRMTSRAMKST